MKHETCKWFNNNTNLGWCEKRHIPCLRDTSCVLCYEMDDYQKELLEKEEESINYETCKFYNLNKEVIGLCKKSGLECSKILNRKECYECKEEIEEDPENETKFLWVAIVNSTGLTSKEPIKCAKVCDDMWICKGQYIFPEIAIENEITRFASFDFQKVKYFIEGVRAIQRVLKKNIPLN